MNVPELRIYLSWSGMNNGMKNFTQVTRKT